MKYEIIKRASFKRGVKRAAKRGLDLSSLESVILLLASGVPLPSVVWCCGNGGKI